MKETTNDYEAVLFYLLAKNFGLKVNGDAFLKLATSFPYAVLRKLRTNEFQLAALLFGQAGFLTDALESDYFMKLHLNKNNFFTDVSNYLSYETGQPTHCYDASKINGKLVFQESEINQEFHTMK